MAVPLSSFISKASPAIPFILKDADLRGGYRVVADIAARDAIHVGAKVAGMLVFVSSDAAFFQWDGAAWAPLDVTSMVSIGTGLTRDAETGDLLVDKSHLDTLYSAKSHNHDDRYSVKTHNHDAAYAAADHNHDEAYAAAEHSHTFESLTEIPKVTGMPGVTVSTTEPTATDGEDGDIWFVVAE